jgi:hypothetical protein
MTTERQIEANRRNAQKSTGPRTPEGKAQSARNATRHGLLSACPVLPQEDAEAYEQLRLNLHKELCPESQLKTLLVNRIAAAQWRLGRIPALEAALFERLGAPVPGADGADTASAHLDPTGDPLRDFAAYLGLAWERDSGPYGGALGRLARYETMLERSTTRLLAEMRRQQAFRLRLERNELLEARREADLRREARHRAGSGGVADLFRDMDPAEAWLAARSGAIRPDQAPTEAAFLRSPAQQDVSKGAAPHSKHPDDQAPTEAAFLRRAPQEPVSKGAAAHSKHPDDQAHIEAAFLRRAPQEPVSKGAAPHSKHPDPAQPQAPAPVGAPVLSGVEGGQGAVFPNEPDLLLGPTLRMVAEQPIGAVAERPADA